MTCPLRTFSGMINALCTKSLRDTLFGQLLVHSGVEDVNRTIIGARAHERIIRMELDSANSLLVISQRFERSGGEIEIEPGESAIVRSDDDIVSGGMNIHRGDPLDSRLQLVDECLFDKVVDLHLSLRGDEEKRLRGGTEEHALHESLEFRHGDLRAALAELVDGDERGGGVAGVHADVVASG